MWAVAMVVDPTDSIYRNLDEETKKEIISEDYIDDPRFKWKDYQYLIDAYTKLILTHIQRSIRVWKLKLEERDKYVINTKYNSTNAVALDNLLKNSGAVYNNLKELENKYLNESGEDLGTTKGGMKESAGEQGLM